MPDGPTSVVAVLVAVLCVAVLLRSRHPRSGPAPAGWDVTVEVVLLSAVDDGLGYGIVPAPLPRGGDPDAVALAASGLDRAGRPGAVSHATSWRTGRDGRLVLTYAALPDPSPQRAVPLDAPSIVSSPDPLRPTPPGLHAHHVAAHGARHLAFLAGTDPFVAQCAAQDPDLWDRVRRVARAPVGEHGRAHALARRWADDGVADPV